MIILQIDINNTMKEIDINTNDINKYFSNNEYECYECLYSWNFQNSIIKCYGLYSENYSNVNKHTLPPGGISNILNEESSSIMLSGNIYICCYKNDIITNYYISDYGTFYYVTNEQNDFEDTSSEPDIENDFDNIESQSKEHMYKESLHSNNNILNYDTTTY